ncbi:hypothetical protein SASPL_104517 [Salvia splendens]|uniref:non-specific serine/threonine protein kinase n=1 Tax=Salvia splendens TaxID=180675 RepID=A0A8X8YJL1_SALSN|nr:hypothetical protein SASPL_104517 [Salvia splendens]
MRILQEAPGRGTPPPQLLSPSELDDGWSGSLSQTASFSWKKPSAKHRETAIIGTATSGMDGNNRYPGGATNTEQWMPAPPPPPPMMSFTLPPPHPSVMWSGYNQSTFSYNDLAAATGGFAQANLLGQGGFGYVHKGVLPNGKEVAVKSLKQNSGQGEREFQAEVDIISRVHHRHLVSLVGYCISGSQRMLVYEFVPNSTLEDHLHGTLLLLRAHQSNFRPGLKLLWVLLEALLIFTKIVRSNCFYAYSPFLFYHPPAGHPKIIHRDIKAANILLDNNFEAKVYIYIYIYMYMLLLQAIFLLHLLTFINKNLMQVADFGLAKLSSETSTHISTRIMGTFGYLAPEYASSGKLTDKSDVYSFGIVLLELITGRRPVDITRDDDDDTLVDWARPILFNVVGEGGSYQELVDPRLENQYEHGEMLRMVTAAAACIRQSARKRPKMSQVVRALEGDVSLDDLQEVMKAQGSLSTSNSDYDLQRYQRMSPGLSNQNFSTAGSDLTDYSQSSSNEQRRPSPGFHYGS